MLKETSLAGAGSLSWGGYWHGRGGGKRKREAVCGSPSITPGSRPWFFPTALVMNRHPAPRDNPQAFQRRRQSRGGVRTACCGRTGRGTVLLPTGQAGALLSSPREKSKLNNTVIVWGFCLFVCLNSQTSHSFKCPVEAGSWTSLPDSRGPDEGRCLVLSHDPLVLASDTGCGQDGA